MTWTKLTWEGDCPGVVVMFQLLSRSCLSRGTVWRHGEMRTNSWSVDCVTPDRSTRSRVNRTQDEDGDQSPHCPAFLYTILANTSIIIINRQPRAVIFDPFLVLVAFTVVNSSPWIKMSSLVPLLTGWEKVVRYKYRRDVNSSQVSN